MNTKSDFYRILKKQRSAMVSGIYFDFRGQANSTKHCNEVFQVYSSEGKYICETTIDKGDYEFKIDRRLKNIVFMKKAIYGLFQLKDSEDISLRLVKVDLD